MEVRLLRYKSTQCVAIKEEMEFHTRKLDDESTILKDRHQRNQPN